MCIIIKVHMSDDIFQSTPEGFSEELSTGSRAAFISRKIHGDGPNPTLGMEGFRPKNVCRVIKTIHFFHWPLYIKKKEAYEKNTTFLMTIV